MTDGASTTRRCALRRAWKVPRPSATAPEPTRPLIEPAATTPGSVALRARRSGRRPEAESEDRSRSGGRGLRSQRRPEAEGEADGRAAHRSVPRESWPNSTARRRRDCGGRRQPKVGAEAEGHGPMPKVMVEVGSWIWREPRRVGVRSWGPRGPGSVASLCAWLGVARAMLLPAHGGAGRAGRGWSLWSAHGRSVRGGALPGTGGWGRVFTQSRRGPCGRRTSRLGLGLGRRFWRTGC